MDTYSSIDPTDKKKQKKKKLTPPHQHTYLVLTPN